MSDEEELDKETIGRKVQSEYFSHFLEPIVLIIDNVGIYVQAAETLPDQTLQEYKDIFSFFDR